MSLIKCFLSLLVTLNNAHKIDVRTMLSCYMFPFRRILLHIISNDQWKNNDLPIYNALCEIHIRFNALIWYFYLVYISQSYKIVEKNWTVKFYSKGLWPFFITRPLHANNMYLTLARFIRNALRLGNEAARFLNLTPIRRRKQFHFMHNNLW